MNPNQPKAITRSDPGRVVIEWLDGQVTESSAADLRRICPCAQCVSETTGIRMHDPATVPDDLEQSGLQLVGNYALSMRFSDGHSTGIYTFEFLRKSAGTA